MKHWEIHKYITCEDVINVDILGITTFEEQFFVTLLSDIQQNINQLAM